MKWHMLFVSLAMTLSHCSSAPGMDFWDKLFGAERCPADCVGKRCCDDYCSKPLPVACPAKCFLSDDYCRKALPCPAPVTRFGCDDYCKKTLPVLCCPSVSDLKCPRPFFRDPHTSR